jgi:hypothetical protein
VSGAAEPGIARPGLATSSSIESAAGSVSSPGQLNMVDKVLLLLLILVPLLLLLLLLRLQVVLGAVWGVSLVYGVMSDQLLSKQADVPCSVTVDPASGLGLASVVLAIVAPTVCGPVAVTIGHLAITAVGMFIKQPPVPKGVLSEELRHLCCIFLLTVIFLLTYVTSMVVCEVYLPVSGSLFTFILVKYITGTSHHLLGPLAILLSRADIRHTAAQVPSPSVHHSPFPSPFAQPYPSFSPQVYRKGGSTQNKTMEITYEQMQKELGLGVQVN